MTTAQQKPTTSADSPKQRLLAPTKDVPSDKGRRTSSRTASKQKPVPGRYTISEQRKTSLKRTSVTSLRSPQASPTFAPSASPLSPMRTALLPRILASGPLSSRGPPCFQEASRPAHCHRGRPPCFQEASHLAMGPEQQTIFFQDRHILCDQAQEQGRPSSQPAPCYSTQQAIRASRKLCCRASISRRR
jgi:hypothetical protein